MIQRKKKYETPNLIFWLNEYSEDSHYPYDIILSSRYVAPHLNKNELKGLADFIYNFLKMKSNEEHN